MFGFGGDKKLTKRDLEGISPDPFSIRESWVEIPGLGKALIREMNSGQRDEWEWFLANRQVVPLTEEQKEFHQLKDGIDRIPDPRELKQYLISLCLVDPATQKLMYNGPDEVKKLPYNLVNFLYEQCAALCGLLRTDHEDAKKNFEQTSISKNASGLPAEPEKASSN